VVDHVVVQQGGGVDELDESRGLQVLATAVGLPAGGRMGRQQPEMMCSATWSTSGTALLRRERMTVSTSAMSAPTRARISSNVM
jgi:hypothetical protein